MGVMMLLFIRFLHEKWFWNLIVPWVDCWWWWWCFDDDDFIDDELLLTMNSYMQNDDDIDDEIDVEM